MINTAQVTPPRVMRRVMHRSYVFGLAAQALASGGRRVSLLHVHWDISGSCDSPHYLELEGRENAHRPTEHATIVAAESGFYWRDIAPLQTPLTLTMEVRCRRCKPCLRLKAHQWRVRAIAEIAHAPRTWFGTLTLSPEEHLRCEFQADHDLAKGSTRWGDLSADEQYRARMRVVGKDVTRWLKRVRKESKAKLRYLMVAEKHKSGLPHLHLLVHESWGSVPTTERCLRLQWHHGFSQFKLVKDETPALYVCKYLTKSMNARVRASIDYGALSDSATLVHNELCEV